MKALIIENEYEIPGEILGFIKDYGKFTEVNEQTFCKHRSLEDIARFIPKADAIIVMSTWLYKDQLEQFVSAFASGMFGKKKFFIFHFTHTLNDWFSEEYVWGFSDFEKLKTNLLTLVQEHEVYSVRSDNYNSKIKITDNYWEGCSSMFSDPNEIKERGPYLAERITYNKNTKTFSDDIL